MASIQASVEIYDRVSQPMNAIITSLYASVNALSALNGAMKQSMNTSGIENAVNDVQDLTAAIQEANTVPLTPAVDQAVSEYEQLKQKAEGTEKHIRKNTEEQEKFNESINSGVHNSNKLVSTIGKAITAYLSIASFKKVVDLSDELTQTTARLNMMNQAFNEINGTAMQTDELVDMVYQSAQNARGSFFDMAAVVAKFGNNARDAFSSQKEIVAFANLIQKQMTIAGASTAEASNAMLQLSQALGSGVLRGDELNSIFEQAPNLIQSIANYMKVPIGQIRAMAKEGQLTANIVKNAIMSSADDINDKFNQMPKTWGQVWQQMKNEVIMAFEPVLDTISRMANDERVQQFFSDIIGGIANIANAVAIAVDFIASEWDILKPVFEAVGGAIAALIAVQLAFNAAAQANPLVWILDIILAVIAAIGLLSQAIADVTGAAKTGAGIICGALNVVKAVFVNLAHQAVTSGYQSVGLIVDAVNNGKNMIIAAITAIASQILQSVANSMAAVKGFIELLNHIPGVNIDTSGVEAVRSGLQGGADLFRGRSKQAWDDFKTPAELIESYQERGNEFRQMNGWQDDWSEGWIQRAWEEGVNFGDNLFAGAGTSEANKFEPLTYDLGDYSNMIDNTGLADNASKAANALEITSEDLKYLRDIAERDVINRFTTAEITVEMGGVTNNVNSDMDLDGVVDYLANGVKEAMEIAAEGVHV